MTTKLKPHSYHKSLQKQLFNYVLSVSGLIFLSPLFIVIAIAIKSSTDSPVFFTQKRVGKDGKVFKFIKFRTMINNAERLKSKYRHLNEANGPVFKISNDPRFTKIGKYLARTGLDELPQLINVIKGEMSLVGPRPFPVSEAKKLAKKQKVREFVHPGITSSWVIEGSHSLSFKAWMRLDKEYVLNASFQKDSEILLKTGLMIIQLFLRRLARSLNS